LHCTESGIGTSTVTDPNLTIPLLMRNKVPDGFETDDRLDVTLRPDEVCQCLLSSSVNSCTDCLRELLDNTNIIITTTNDSNNIRAA